MTASTITRAVGYTGTLQRLVVPSGYAAEVTAYLWGGGGGGGGCDSQVGGPGSGSGYSSYTFNVSPGDIIDVAVGGSGGAGGSNAGSAGGGAGGASYTIPNSTVSYSGGNGSAAGPVPISGGGGGGGGATVLLLNSTVIAVAGGGGGGGGGGNGGGGQTAPGSRGQSGTFTSGQNGQPKGGDGGGAGGGGGGYDGSGGGGQGGSINGGDVGGNAGYYGGSFGDETANPNLGTPGNYTSPYYPSTLGVGYGGQGASRATYTLVARDYFSGLKNYAWIWGFYYVEDQPARGAGAGGPGFAVLQFTPQSIWAKDLGDWQPVENLYVKANDAWQPVRAVYVKQNNNWEVVVADNALAPNPTSQGTTNYSRNPRAYS